MRGAEVTDIAILVVAADDEVKPQTIEALNHAQAAQVPIVVAVNKADKEGADPTKVRSQLTEYGLVAEDFGGDTMFVDVSALQGMGIGTSLEAVLLTADAALELQANPIRTPRVSRSKRTWTAAVVRLPPFWSSAEPCVRETPSWRETRSVAFARCWTMPATPSRKPGPPLPSKFSA